MGEPSGPRTTVEDVRVEEAAGEGSQWRRGRPRPEPPMPRPCDRDTSPSQGQSGETGGGPGRAGWRATRSAQQPRTPARSTAGVVLALLHTPGPAPPSAGFFSLKAPASTGRSRFPARPRLPPPQSAGTPPQVAAAAQREPHKRQSGRAPGDPGAVPFCAPSGRLRP